jgi:hypothetical protein
MADTCQQPNLVPDVKTVMAAAQPIKAADMTSTTFNL